MADVAEIKRRLRHHDCTVAENHLEQAASALARGEPESASAQVRSAVEALFDCVAHQRLASAKRGGAARKELEARGVLTDRKARFIQAFIDYLGTAGSHAGTCSPDEATGRYMTGLGILLIGLGLLPDLMTVQEVMKALTPPPSDDRITTSCRTCGTVQKLVECEIRRDGPDTVYVCRNGCQVLVVVGATGDSPWPGRGYRIGEYVIRNAADLLLALPGSTNQVLIPASPAALMKSRPAPSGGS